MHCAKITELKIVCSLANKNSQSWLCVCVFGVGMSGMGARESGEISDKWQVKNGILPVSLYQLSKVKLGL